MPPVGEGPAHVGNPLVRIPSTPEARSRILTPLARGLRDVALREAVQSPREIRWPCPQLWVALQKQLETLHLAPDVKRAGSGARKMPSPICRRCQAAVIGLTCPPNMAERVVVAAAREFPPNMAETYRRLAHPASVLDTPIAERCVPPISILERPRSAAGRTGHDQPECTDRE